MNLKLNSSQCCSFKVTDLPSRSWENISEGWSNYLKKKIYEQHGIVYYKIYVQNENLNTGSGRIREGYTVETLKTLNNSVLNIFQLSSLGSSWVQKSNLKTVLCKPMLSFNLNVPFLSILIPNIKINLNFGIP